jgi:hypothetical protein
MRSFMPLTPPQILYSGDQIKENKVAGQLALIVEMKRHTGVWRGSLKERDRRKT